MKQYDDIIEYLDQELNRVERGLVAIPTYEFLNDFTQANNGTSDFLLMQMAKNYGYQLALTNMKNELTKTYKNEK
tara:strand:+ start:1642 stop:1866 length:225 start_codon:yes stop_codon:yes gene_type:complete